LFLLSLFLFTVTFTKAQAGFVRESALFTHAVSIPHDNGRAWAFSGWHWMKKHFSTNKNWRNSKFGASQNSRWRGGCYRRNMSNSVGASDGEQKKRKEKHYAKNGK